MLPSPPPELTTTTPSGSSGECDIFDEEKSWFYYLAEISFRRIMNRAMALIGQQGEQGWSHNIRETAKLCESVNEQINIW